MSQKTFCEADGEEIPEGLGISVADYRPATLGDAGCGGDFHDEDCLIRHLTYRANRRATEGVAQRRRERGESVDGGTR